VTVIGEIAQQVVLAPDGGFSFSGRRSRQSNRDWLIPRGAEPKFTAQFAGCTEVDAAAAETMRIADGIPAVPVDVGPTDLPNEGALETEAISYTKGCYLGQEVMARLRSMGQVRRKLLRVQIESNERPIERSPLFFGDRTVAELRSLAKDPSGNGFIGFAMVSLLQAGANRRFTLTPGATPNVTLLDTP
jgi:folate-binding protein YgfZ